MNFLRVCYVIAGSIIALAEGHANANAPTAPLSTCYQGECFDQKIEAITKEADGRLGILIAVRSYASAKPNGMLGSPVMQRPIPDPALQLAERPSGRGVPSKEERAEESVRDTESQVRTCVRKSLNPNNFDLGAASACAKLLVAKLQREGWSEGRALDYSGWVVSDEEAGRFGLAAKPYMPNQAFIERTDKGIKSTVTVLDKWCSEAQLPSSIAICSDPELRSLVVERQRAYDEAKARLTPEEQKALLADQNGWVRSYPRACGLDNNRPPPLPLRPEMRDCMATAGRARIAYLETYGRTRGHGPTNSPLTAEQNAAANCRSYEGCSSGTGV